MLNNFRLKAFNIATFVIFVFNFTNVSGFQQEANTSDSVQLAKFNTNIKNIDADQVDSIIKITDKEVEVYQSNNNDYQVCRINQSAGSLFSSYGYFNLAEKYYEDALKGAQNLKNKELEIDILLSIGVIWGKKGDFLKSESYFLNTLLLSQKANYPKGIVSAYFKIGVIRTKQNKALETQMYYNKVDSVNKSNRTNFLEFELINNRAIFYAMKGDLGNALKQFELSYSLATKYKRPIDQVLALQNIGLVYKERNDYPIALKYLNQGVKLAKKYGLKEEGLRIAIIKPAILTEQKQYDQAEKELKGYLSESIKLGMIDLTSEIYDNLIGIAKEKGDFKSALTYFEQNTELKEKQTNKEKQRALAEANASLGLYTANQKVLESETLLFQKTREKNILLVIVIFGFILTIGLVIVLLRLKKLNDRLNLNKAQLTESNNIKNKLFSIIGHDLRSSQGVSLGILQLIESGELDPVEQQKYLGTVIKQSESSLTVLNDLLLWGQAQIKGQKSEKELITILQVVQNAINLNLDSLTKKQINLKQINLENCSIFMDANHFAFVVRNLIANAVKFTSNNGNIQIYTEPYNQKFIKICIADDGIGIPETELKRVFSPESTSRKGTNNEKGNGLGLTLCKEFITANGGEIWAEQNSTQGTKICFTVEKAV